MRRRKPTADMQACQEEVTQRLVKHRRSNPFNYDVFKTSLEVLHVPTPIQKTSFAEGYSFSDRDADSQRAIWLSIWQHSSIIEVRLQALRYYQTLPPEMLPAHQDDLLELAQSLDNWCESDYLSCLLAQLMEQQPKRMTELFVSWNGDEDFWLRRQSVVSLFYYQALRRVQPGQRLVFRLLKPLLGDPEHYVQKAVGWTLREALQVYPDATYRFLDRHLQQLSATAFTTVMEKAEAERKKQYKAQRKRLRKAAAKR